MWRVGFGSNRRNEHTFAQSTRGVAHPLYNGQVATNRQNDIGIIFLDQPQHIVLRPNVHPIAMSWNNDKRMQDENVQGMIAGYAPEVVQGPEGLQVLQAAHVRILNQTMCEQAMPGMNAATNFCAFDMARGSDFCNGDQVNWPTIIRSIIKVLTLFKTFSFANRVDR